MIMAILAGGLATRLGTLTQAVPKSMLPVAGEPFIGHQLRLLARNGFDKVHICLGHLGSMVSDYVGDGSMFGVSVTYSSEGERLLGTAGALALARNMLGDRFGVMYGDSYLPVSYDIIGKRFQDSSCAGMMTVWHNFGKLDRSNVIVSNDRVCYYSASAEDRTQCEWIDYGLSFLRSEVLADLPTDRATPLSHIWQQLVARAELEACPVEGRFYEIGSLQGYEELKRLAEQKEMP